MSGDTISLLYDKTNGKLQFEFINHPDGSWTVYQWDTELQYTWQWAVYNGTGKDTFFSIGMQNDDGSYTNETFDLAHGDALQQITNLHVDKTWSQWTYDTANAYVWAKTWVQYNSANQLVADGGTNDDGTYWANWHDLAHGGVVYQTDQYTAAGADRQTVWDTSGQQAWSSYVEDWTPISQRVDQVFTNRDGTTVTQQYDLAHGQALQVKDTRYADGSMHRVVNDTAGTNTWSYYTADFDTSGHLKAQTLANRDGTYLETEYDPAHGGAMSETATFQADHSVTQTIYDTAGTQTWSSEVSHYDTSGKFLDETMSMRGGATVHMLADTSTHDTVVITEASANYGASMMIMSGSNMTSLYYSPDGHLHGLMYYSGGHGTNLLGQVAYGNMTLSTTQMAALADASTKGEMAGMVAGAACGGIFSPLAVTVVGAAFTALVSVACGKLVQQMVDSNQATPPGGAGGLTPDQARQFCMSHPDVCVAHGN